VWKDEDRPVWVSVHDHAHTYEIAWRDTADGPVITDLRVRSDDGTPITSDTLRRINTDTLLKAAQRYDTSRAAEAGRDLRATFDAALGDSAVDTSGIEAFRWTEGVMDAMVRHAPHGAKVPAATPRRGGRPKLSGQFLAQVAEWAREGRDRKAAVYPYVAQRASAQLDYVASDDTVKGWVRRCKSVGLLGLDELRQPRTPRTATDNTE
jgi:hypothetical protein